MKINTFQVGDKVRLSNGVNAVVSEVSHSQCYRCTSDEPDDRGRDLGYVVCYNMEPRG